MKATSAKSDIEIQELLNQTIRLRLFRNTSKELSTHIGYNLQSNNGIKKIPPLTVRSIFHRLSRETYEQLNSAYDLEEILDAYSSTSTFYDRHVKGKKRVHQTENIHALLKYIYIDAYRLPKEKAFLQKLATEIYNGDIDGAILLLLMLDVLPPYTSTRGDVRNIRADFNKVYFFLKELIRCSELLFNDLPILDRLEKESRELAYCNRAYLIYATSTVLQTYRGLANPSNLYELNMEVDKVKVLPEVEESFWVEPEMQSAPTVFWKFQLVCTNDFFLYRYALNASKKQIFYVRYEVLFLEDRKGQLTMHVDHPEAVLAMLEERQGGDRQVALFGCELDQWQAPDTLSLRPLLSDAVHFPARKLIRLHDEMLIGQLQRALEDGKYEVKNQFPEAEYNFWVTPPAVTSEYIYFNTEVEPDPDARLYYRVTKSLNPGLALVNTNDAVGILEKGDRKYLAFVPLLLYLDVTDDEACRKSVVDLVMEIVI